MTLTVGRCVLPDPSEVTPSGPYLSMSGVFVSTAATAANRAAEAQAREAQFNGMFDNPDEDVFPLVWTSEGKYDGFYAAEQGSWTWLNDGSGRLCVAAWSVTLRAVTDRVQPRREVQYTTLVRTNDHGVTTGTVPVAWWPGDDLADYSFTGTTWERTSESGVVEGGLVAVSSPTTAAVSNGTTPSDHYIGAAKLELQGADGEWYPAVGRNVPVVSGAWRLGNGLVRVQPTASPHGYLQMSVYDGTGWDVGPIFCVIAVTVGPSINRASLVGSTKSGEFATMSIVRNDPDAVVLRCVSVGGIFHTFTVKRGSLLVEIAGSTTNDGLAFSPNTATSNLSSAAASVVGVVTTSNDANGHKWALMSAVDVTTDNTVGAFYHNPSTDSPRWAVAAVLNGTSASTYDTAANLLLQFMIPSSTQTRIVAR